MQSPLLPLHVSLQPKSFKTNSIRLIVRRFIEFVRGVLVHAVEPGRGMFWLRKLQTQQTKLSKGKLKTVELFRIRAEGIFTLNFEMLPSQLRCYSSGSEWVCVCCVVRLHDFLCKDLCVNFLIEFNLRGMRFVCVRFSVESDRVQGVTLWRCKLAVYTDKHTHTSHILNGSTIASPAKTHWKRISCDYIRI